MIAVYAAKLQKRQAGKLNKNDILYAGKKQAVTVRNSKTVPVALR